MLPLEHKILFFLFALIAGLYGLWGFYRLYLRVKRGAPASEVRWNELGSRLWYAVKTSLTQERTFRRRPWVSALHSLIFYGFVYYLLVNVVDGLEGFFPFHIYSDSFLGAAYNLLADVLSFLVLVGVVSLVVRRLFHPSKRDFRFTEKTLLHPLLKRNFIQRDSLIVSGFIFFHVGSRILGNAAKMVEEARDLGRYDAFQPISSALGSALFGGLSDSAIQGWRVFGYWGALGSVLAFLAYFPYTKHIHIFMAPLNYALKRPVGSGVLPPMKGLEEAMEAEEPRLGAEKLEDLEWPRLLDAYACIQCNRCQDVCPANATGKALSPAALEINKRMELNVLTSGGGGSLLAGGGPTTLGLAAQSLAAPAGAPHPSPFTLRPTAFESGASTAHPLLEFAINEESVWACTTCGACMQVCPVQDEQMLDIIDIRRHQVMVAGEFPPQLQTAFRGMERASNPWGISRDKRLEWAEGLKVPTIDENPEPDVIYWVGCAASYDPGAQKVARSFVQLLDKAGVNYAVLGKKEACTGDSARRSGNEFLYQTLAQENVETLNSVRPKLIVATCPHCMNAIGHEYKQLGGHYRTIHHTEYLETLVAAGKLPLAQLEQSVTYHDPCYLGRHNGVYDAPRTLITQMAGQVLELERSRDNSFCCGAGGAQFWKEEEEGRERVSDNRFREIQARLDGAAQASAEYQQTGKVVAVGCPFCKSMMNSTPEKAGRDDIVVRDVAELMLESVQRATGEWVAPAEAPDSTLEESAVPVVPNAELPMHRTGETPAADADPDVLGQTSAEVINAQPGSPLANAHTQPEAQAAAPSPVTSSSADSSPRKSWKPRGGGDDVAQAQAQAAPVAEAPAASAPARKSWKPKAGADDVSAAAATSVQPPASSPAPAGEAAPPARKAWKPKGSGDDVSAAPVPQAGAAAPAGAAPARPAWKPRAATQPEAQAEVSAAPAAAPADPASGERKKWSPKGAAPAVPEAAAQSQPEQPQPEAAAPTVEPVSPAPQPGERKKWAPKAATSAAPAERPVAAVETVPVTAEPAVTPGERPKWQPKAKAPVPQEASALQPAAAAPITEHVQLAEVGENALERGQQATGDASPAGSGTGESGRKKWVPRKKD
ncbi:heterodisulfide reductase-related iron-sulfur binding cluster [Deinococcus budaensis]|uniref:Fe-S oxidoreductase/nitrate reductase gamma subunit n=1 Tax=Deinococcus budaensis TaxID=1665626 RepID=A0A7W8LNN3_9DEIO|nr:heterodisulfide reductase-related iron-sulfur binding cluster [Deinococcus budaensis]MBB5232747.1 Fe-S oxidoreductase/nitrate reductase gamma subunit [Deinococcus budaensis]